ncbi:hypothetical protein JS756_03615 [Streptomyces actuosus]|uniref:Subtilisin inhibitor domain-containing protein n=1 Tax=Streptomyces actuosus TaxID=1885 RepID=A0ABS2VJF3_STRAS|nr:hypothetical protein [Streptomyces actuosus]
MSPFSAPVRRLLVGTAASLLTAATVVTLPSPAASAASATPAVSAVSAVSVTTAASAASAASAVPPRPVRARAGAGAGAGRESADHLVVQVRQAGVGRDGTYELSCHPGGGSHPDVDGACRTVERNTRWGTETFAPVPEGTVCTMQYGGPATAHVTGIWAGRPVDAVFGRGNGCEIGRWDRFVPLLPDMTAPGAASPSGALPLPGAVPAGDAGAGPDGVAPSRGGGLSGAVSPGGIGPLRGPLSGAAS